MDILQSPPIRRTIYLPQPQIAAVPVHEYELRPFQGGLFDPPVHHQNQRQNEVLIGSPAARENQRQSEGLIGSPTERPHQRQHEAQHELQNERLNEQQSPRRDADDKDKRQSDPYDRYDKIEPYTWVNARVDSNPPRRYHQSWVPFPVAPVHNSNARTRFDPTRYNENPNFTDSGIAIDSSSPYSRHKHNHNPNEYLHPIDEELTLHIPEDAEEPGSVPQWAKQLLSMPHNGFTRHPHRRGQGIPRGGKLPHYRYDKQYEAGRREYMYQRQRYKRPRKSMAYTRVSDEYFTMFGGVGAGGRAAYDHAEYKDPRLYFDGERLVPIKRGRAAGQDDSSSAYARLKVTDQQFHSLLKVGLIAVFGVVLICSLVLAFFLSSGSSNNQGATLGLGLQSGDVLSEITGRLRLTGMDYKEEMNDTKSDVFAQNERLFCDSMKNELAVLDACTVASFSQGSLIVDFIWKTRTKESMSSRTVKEALLSSRWLKDQGLDINSIVVTVAKVPDPTTTTEEAVTLMTTVEEDNEVEEDVDSMEGDGATDEGGANENPETEDPDPSPALQEDDDTPDNDDDFPTNPDDDPTTDDQDDDTPAAGEGDEGATEQDDETIDGGEGATDGGEGATDQYEPMDQDDENAEEPSDQDEDIEEPAVEDLDDGREEEDGEQELNDGRDDGAVDGGTEDTDNTDGTADTEDPPSVDDTEDPPSEDDTEDPNTEDDTEDPDTEDTDELPAEDDTEDPPTEDQPTGDDTEDPSTEDDTEDPPAEDDTEDPDTEDTDDTKDNPGRGLGRGRT